MRLKSPWKCIYSVVYQLQYWKRWSIHVYINSYSYCSLFDTTEKWTWHGKSRIKHIWQDFINVVVRIRSRSGLNKIYCWKYHCWIRNAENIAMSLIVFQKMKHLYTLNTLHLRLTYLSVICWVFYYHLNADIFRDKFRPLSWE